MNYKPESWLWLQHKYISPAQELNWMNKSTNQMQSKKFNFNTFATWITNQHVEKP